MIQRQISALLYFIAVAAIFACLSGGKAYAVDRYWSQDADNDGTAAPVTGRYLWTDASNWGINDGQGASPSAVPGANDTARFYRGGTSANNRPIYIDLNGAANLDGANGRILGQVNGGEWWTFYNSANLTLQAGTPTSLTYFTSPTDTASLVAAANASPQFTVTTIDWQKEANPTFYVPVQTDRLLLPERNGSRWYGDVDATLIDYTRNSGWLSDNFFYGDVSAGTWKLAYRNDGNAEDTEVEGTTTINTLLRQRGAHLILNDFHASGEIAQANDARLDIGGRFWGTATYVKEADNGVAGAPDNYHVPNPQGGAWDPNDPDNQGTAPQINLLGTATLAPGDSIGTLGGTALSVHAASGSTYEWEVGASPASSTPGVGWDLSLANVFDLDGTLNFEIVESGLTESISTTDQFAVLGANSFDLADFVDANVTLVAEANSAYEWDISDATFDLIPDFADLDGDTSNGNEDALVLSGISAQATAAAVPEPASVAIWTLIGLGLVGFGCFRLRRK